MLIGGAEEIRTPDILLAKQTLYQLSYSPVAPSIQHATEWSSSFNPLKRTGSLKIELCDEIEPINSCELSTSEVRF
jgi:hypothetical protein